MTATRTVRARKWAPYGACGTCKASASAPCVNLQVQRAGHQTPRPLAKPHTGRRRQK